MNFNMALEKATQLSLGHLAQIGETIYLVRDLHGRIRILLKKRPGKENITKLEVTKALTDGFVEQLGDYAYAAKDLVMYSQELRHIQLPNERTSRLLASIEGLEIRIHDRLLMCGEWDTRPETEVSDPKRFTLFSMKGGVGRSTTATILAWHLAKKGKRVLVFDLDLESPGVGSTLLPQGSAYGIVDWFVEDALGHGASVLEEMVAASPLSDSLPGHIAVVPAFGTETGDYLAKLGRVYLERGPNGPESWSARLKRLVSALEQQEKPDVVLLDSRTGLHDTSAALVLAMGAQTLLFAVDSRQTWNAYDFLFQHWKQHPDVDKFRDKLWVLGSMVPETEQTAYLQSLKENAWSLFLYLYEETGPESEPEVFTFGQNEEAGNHFPRPILWQRGLQSFDPTSDLSPQLVEAAYGSFLRWFDTVLFNEAV